MTLSKNRKSIAFSGCAAIAVMAGGTAWSADATTGVAGDGTLEEVVVTAQRRSERLVDVPMSVTAVSPAQMEKAGVVSIHDLGNVAAGVQVNFAGCCTQPAIRGISTLTSGVGFENNVATYVDGFYTPDNVTVNGDLANIAGIQVLKGPQGTLWGRNATGGAILIATEAPSSTLTGKMQASYGRYDDRSLSGYVSGPITDRVRYSIAAYGRKSDGYDRLLDTSGNVVGNAAPQRQASIRTKLEVDVASNLTATLAYNYGLSSDPRGILFTVMAYPAASLPKPPARASQPYTFSTNRKTELLGITNEGTLKLVYKIPVGTLTSYTGVAQRRTKQAYDFDASYADLSYADQRWSQDTFQQSVDLNVSSIDKVDLVIGGSYYRDRLKTNDYHAYANNRLTSTYQVGLQSEAYAAYVDGSYHLTDAVVLSAGARYTHEAKSGAYRTILPSGLISGTPGANKATFSAFTPRASIRYEFSPDSNVYASISRGFRTGGFQPLGNSDPAQFLPYAPEKITAYEVGYKVSRSWYRFDTAAFYYDYSNLQVGVTVPSPNGNGSLITKVVNAPKAEVYGIDADLTMRPVDHLNVHLGLAWLHGRYTNFHNATGNGLNISTGLNVTNQPQDWTGQQMTRAPNFSGLLGVDYEFQDVVGGALMIGANLRYTSSFITNAPSLYGPLAGALANEQRYRQGAYMLVNAQATWTGPNAHYKLAIFVNNLTDKRYRLTYSGGAFGDYSSWASPRTYGVRAAYQF